MYLLYLFLFFVDYLGYVVLIIKFKIFFCLNIIIGVFVVGSGEEFGFIEEGMFVLFFGILFRLF